MVTIFLIINLTGHLNLVPRRRYLILLILLLLIMRMPENQRVTLYNPNHINPFISIIQQSVQYHIFSVESQPIFHSRYASQGYFNRFIRGGIERSGHSNPIQHLPIHKIGVYNLGWCQVFQNPHVTTTMPSPAKQKQRHKPDAHWKGPDQDWMEMSQNCGSPSHQIPYVAIPETHYNTNKEQYERFWRAQLVRAYNLKGDINLTCLDI